MEELSATQIKIPKPLGEVVGAYVITSFIVFFVAVAVSNLFHRIAIIPSLLWLILVAAVNIGSLREIGGRRNLVDLLGSFSRKHFAEIVETGVNTRDICFGFKSLGRRLFYESVNVSKIESLEWRTGQATGMAGRDMNDWHVILWFNHDDPAKSEKQKKWHRKPDQDLYIVGPFRSKKATASFGRDFLSFLEKAGVALVQGEDDSTFIRESKKELLEEEI